MKSTCQQVFQDAINERLKHPLDEGLYKLEEGRHSLQAFADEIQTIAALKRKQVRKHHLQQCQTFEIAHWLRSMPVHVAHILGRTVLPAFGALAADGVPPHELVVLEKMAADRIKGIIANLDIARQTLADPMEIEYERMKAGTPTLLPEIQEALDLIQGVETHWFPLGQRRNSSNRTPAPT